MIRGGFLPVSRLFLNNYRTMGISMEEAMLILHLIDHSWGAEDPFPSAEHFAKVTGKSGQTVRAYLRSLSLKKYLTPVRTEAGDKTYSWAPLLDALKDLTGEPTKEEPLPDPIPVVVAEDPLKKLIDTQVSLAADRSKSRTPVQTKPDGWRKLNAFQEKSPSQYNAKDIELLLAMKWREKWTSPPPRFAGRDLKHAKDLIKIYGSETVSAVITWAVENWERVCQEFNIKGYPNMPLFWGFKTSLFTFFIDGDPSKKPNWGSQFTQEESREEGSEIGW